MLRKHFSIALFSLGLALTAATARASVDPAPLSTREPTLNKQIQKLLEDAQRAAEAGNLEKAEHLLELAASTEPKNPYIIAQLAMMLNRTGNYDATLSHLRAAQSAGVFDDTMLAPMFQAMLSLGENQKVLDLYPDPGPNKRTYAAGTILRARASALQVLGDTAGATAAMNRSLAILSDYDGAMTAGRIDMMQGNIDGADAQADAALKLKPNDIDARALKIDVAMERGNLKDAQRMVDQLVADNPRSAFSLLVRAKFYLSQNRADLAEPDIDRILAQMPNMPLASYFKAVILAQHSDAKGAWKLAQNLPTEFIQGNPSFALNIANMAVAGGYVGTGANILAAAVLHFPDQLELRLRLADLRLVQKSTVDAFNALRPIQDSNDPRVLVLHARVALLKNDRAGAQKYIEQALDAGGGEELRSLDKDTALQSLSNYIARHPHNKLVKKQYALLLLGFGETDKAKAAYEELVQADPTDAVALNNLSWLIVNSDPARALALAHAAVKADSNSANFLDTLGSMQLKRGDYKGAVASLQKAHDLVPDNPEFAYHLVLGFEASGHGDQDLALLQQIVKRKGFRDWDAAQALLANKVKVQAQAGP